MRKRGDRGWINHIIWDVLTQSQERLDRGAQLVKTSQTEALVSF